MNPKEFFTDIFHRYFGVDPKGRSLKSIIPFGFTGQGSLWFSDTIPDGWLKCDGSLLKRVDYPDLYIVIGTAWNIGGEASTEFRLPNLTGRVPVGKDSGTFNALNNRGGAETHALTGGELATHNHTVGINRSDSEAGGYGLTLTTGFQNRVMISQPASAFTTGNAGSGNPHNNLQPYNTVNYIIKT